MIVYVNGILVNMTNLLICHFMLAIKDSASTEFSDPTIPRGGDEREHTPNINISQTEHEGI
jgi:hypothetical protein